MPANSAIAALKVSKKDKACNYIHAFAMTSFLQPSGVPGVRVYYSILSFELAVIETIQTAIAGIVREIRI